MPKIKILLVDNDVDFLETRREFLVREGYRVVTACSHLEAREKLKHDAADVAVIDVRLLNDDDEKDISGLEFAKEASHSFPVIILTGYPSAEYMRRTLGPQFDGTQVAYDFLAKEDGPVALISAIRRTLEISKHADPIDSELSVSPVLRKDHRELQAFNSNREPKSATNLVSVKLDVPEQMLKDYELARGHARWIGWARLGLVISGVLVILFGVVMVVLGYREAGIIGVITGAITEVLGGLVTKFANDANRRWEQFHKELMLLHKNKTQRKKK